MNRDKTLNLIIAVSALITLYILLSGCGGGGESSTAVTHDTATSPQAPAAPPMPTQRAQPLVAFMGDSITYLWDQSYWVSDPSDLLSYHLPSVIDAGVSGQTCDLMAARFQHDILDQHPDVVVIMCGTNDVFHLGSLDTQADLFAMVEAAQAAGVKVIVGVVPPDAYVPGSDGWNLHAQWNAGVIEGAKTYGYALADYYTPMMLPDGTRNDALFDTGSAHPVAAGYAVMWGVLSGVLAKI